MKTGLREQCDLFIQRCQDVIAMRDINEARKILIEATSIFEKIIPNWQGGLMSQFTGFYLDDAQMILGKLKTYQKNGYSASPRDFRKTSYIERSIETSELFESAIARIQALEQDAGLGAAASVEMVRQLEEVVLAADDFVSHWERIKPFLRWVATIHVAQAELILPLLLRCVNRER